MAELKLPNPTAEKIGVGGWLALLVVGLTILTPLVGYGSMTGEIRTSEATYPQLLANPLWANLKMVMWGAFGATSALAITAGSMLGSTFKRSTPMRAIWLILAFCLLIPPLQWICVYFVYPPSANEMVTGTITREFQGVVYCAVWCSYLVRSRRVKNTYTQ